MDILTVYEQYLDNKQKERTRNLNQDYSHYWSASSAGHCYKKQLFGIYKCAKSDMDFKSKSLLRLGTIVHSDVESALREQASHPATQEGEISFIEYEVVDDYHRVIGHLDYAYIDREERTLTIYDLKTAAAYKWSKKFGRKPDENPSFKYEMQIATYAMALIEEWKPFLMEFSPPDEEVKDRVQMFLMWYNKNTSQMRHELISSDWYQSVSDYWMRLHDILFDMDELPENLNSWNGAFMTINKMIRGRAEEGSPFESWECKYCPYETICR